MAIVGSKEVIEGREVTIAVEVDDLPRGATAADWDGESRGARIDKIPDATRDVFGDGLALARDCAAKAVHAYHETAEDLRPDSFELQLAIKLDAEAGAIVTKLGAGAQMQVTMKWEKRRDR